MIVEVDVIVRVKDGEEVGRTTLKYEVPGPRMLDSSDVMQDVGDWIEERL